MVRNRVPPVVAALVVASCSSPSQSGLPATGTPEASTEAGGGSEAGAPAQDASPTGSDAGSATNAIAIPFYVSDQFVPTGFMGDSPASSNAITLAHDAVTCKAPRAPNAGGDCFTATWAPALAAGAASAWAGVYWQSPANNWGALPGKAIAPGATKVSFQAAGAKGGEVIQLSVGGINTNGADPSLAYGDTFAVKMQPITLTTDWTQYEVSLQGAQYATVLGGFCWVASATTSESITFYLDDIQWE